jgi:hypothetical protein
VSGQIDEIGRHGDGAKLGGGLFAVATGNYRHSDADNSRRAAASKPPRRRIEANEGGFWPPRSDLRATLS